MAINLSKEQLEVVETKEPYVVVMSNAAAGKTRMLIERIRYLLKKGVAPSSIVAITFTNNAAEEMQSRLGKDYVSSMFIGTIHSYANLLLMKHGISTSSAIKNENFDKFFDLVSDNPKVIEHVEHLLLDEAQDSTPKQFEFILEMVRPKNYMIFGDPKQSIYSFNGGNPNLIIGLTFDDDVVTYSIIDNYRNGTEIMKFSNGIVDKMKNIRFDKPNPKSGITGLVEKIRRSEITELIEGTDYSEWAILCRSNRTVDDIIYMLSQANIPALTFRQAEITNATIEANQRKKAVKVLTIHSAKGLEFPKVIVAEQVWGSQENLRLMYVAATRAKEELYIVQGR